jgi:hypothetical protein
MSRYPVTEPMARLDSSRSVDSEIAPVSRSEMLNAHVKSKGRSSARPDRRDVASRPGDRIVSQRRHLSGTARPVADQPAVTLSVVRYPDSQPAQRSPGWL